MQRIGVFVCHCGTNIAATVDVKAVAEALSHEPGVVIATEYPYMCSQAGQDMIRQAVQEQPGKTAYEIAGSITWKIRAKNWDDFPIGQKWFAVGETVAHLDYLVNRNRLTVQQGSDGMDRYTV